MLSSTSRVGARGRYTRPAERRSPGSVAECLTNATLCPCGGPERGEGCDNAPALVRLREIERIREEWRCMGDRSILKTNGIEKESRAD